MVVYMPLRIYGAINDGCYVLRANLVKQVIL